MPAGDVVGVPDAVAVWVADAVGVAVADGVPVADAVAVAVAVDVDVAVAVADAVVVAVGDAVTVVAVPVGDADADGVTLAVGEAVRVAVGVLVASSPPQAARLKASASTRTGKASFLIGPPSERIGGAYPPSVARSTQRSSSPPLEWLPAAFPGRIPPRVAAWTAAGCPASHGSVTKEHRRRNRSRARGVAW